MPQYMLSVHAPAAPPSTGDPTPDPPVDEEAMAAHMAAVEALETEMRDAGAWAASARLHGPETATVVRRDDGGTLLTDGPYLESKEHVAGFYVITADDLDDALAWAARVVDTFGMPAIEVRPLAGYDA